MSGSSYGGYNQRKDRKRYLLLLLLPLAYLLGGVSFAFVRGEPPTPTPIVIAAPTASPSEDASEASPSEEPTKTPRPSEAVAGVSASPSITAPPTPNPSAVVVISDVSFRISGTVQNLLPGVPQTIRLTLTNPNAIAIYITSLGVRLPVDSSPTGCRPADNIAIVQSDASVANPIAIAAGRSVTLSAAPRAPQMTLLNLPGVNQDVCKNKSFTLTFTGSAHS